MTAPVAIVGGGFAGLTAAAALRRARVPIVLYEAGKDIGGLATSTCDAAGFSYDFGAHFVTNRLAAAIGIGAECYDVRSYGESVILGRRPVSYPLGLLTVPRFAGSAAATRLRAALHASPAVTAADWFERTYGAAIAREIALPLLEAWSGKPAVELSAAVGQQMPGSIARTLWLKLLSAATHRAIASGYCMSQPESRHVWHVYPQGGVVALGRRLAAEVADAIELEARVSAIYVEDERVVAIRVNDRDVAVSAVLCSAPLNVLARLIQGSEKLAYLARFQYRPMVFVNLRLRGRGLLPDVVVWTPERDVPFFRVTEAPQAMPSLAPDGKTILTADIGASVGDAHWSMDDDALGRLCVERLTALVPDIGSRYLGCRVARTPLAYPIFALAYERERAAFARGAGVIGLYPIGRNGEFKHLLMEDVYWRTRAIARRVAAGVAS